MADPSTSDAPHLMACSSTGRLSRVLTRVRIIAGISIVALGLAVFLTLYVKTRRTRFPLTPAPPEPTAPQPAAPATRRGPIRTLEDRFGANRVVDLILTGSFRGVDVKGVMDAKAPKLIGSIQRDWECRAIGRNWHVKLAPVDDLNALAKRIDFGTVTNIDQTRRRITVKTDPVRFTAE